MASKIEFLHAFKYVEIRFDTNDAKFINLQFTSYKWKKLSQSTSSYETVSILKGIKKSKF